MNKLYKNKLVRVFIICLFAVMGNTFAFAESIPYSTVTYSNSSMDFVQDTNEGFFNLDPIIGKPKWTAITFNNKTFIVPCLDYVTRFILLLVLTYFLIRTLLTITSLFR